MVLRLSSSKTLKPAGSLSANTFSANKMLNLLRRFDPFADLDWHDLSSVAHQAKELILPPHRVLVKPPRRLRGVWYLSAGTLIDDCTGTCLKSGSERCRLPVWPEHSSLRSLTTVRLLFFAEGFAPQLQNSSLIPRLSSLAKTGEWLETLAASPLLRLLYQRRGAAGWQSWLRGLVELEVSEQTVLIQQGAVGDYFYVVQTGVAVVDGGTELVQISAGGFFGEDALLSGQRRNAAVCMPSGGRVLRGDASQLFGLVDDLWWVLARKPDSWKNDNRLLSLHTDASTDSLRGWLDRLPADDNYALAVGSEQTLQDLVLLLLIHRGYNVVLRESELASTD